MQENLEKPKINSFTVGIIFLVSGISLFIISVFSGSQIISLIGLGLTFWGAIFLLIPPPKHVEASFLITSSLPDYMTIDRMLNYLTPKTEAYNIPPCPRDIYLPEHLEGLKETVTFIPAENSDGIAEIEDIARGKFLIEKPKGILIASPGIGLLNKIEQKRNTDFTKIPLSELDETLPYLFKELNLAKEIDMTTNEDAIILQINSSLYKNLYDQKYNLKSIKLLGCPLVNAVACAIAKSTGKPILIQEIKTASNGKTTTATFKIYNRKFEAHKKLTENNGLILLRRTDLILVINDSIRIIDLAFNILAGLQRKRVNWQHLENFSKDFGEAYNFTAQSMPPLKLNFIRISSAIRNQIPKETSKETYNILKIIYDYFESLNFEDDLEGSVPNFLSAKTIISAYYTLNDLLLGKVVGEKENEKENHQLEVILQILANNTDFKVNLEELKFSMNNTIPENNLERMIDDSREIFKEQLKQLSSLYSLSASKK